MTHYVAIIDRGELIGPYASFDAADDEVQRTQRALAYVADENGNVHPDVDPLVMAEIIEARGPNDIEWIRVAP